MASHPTSKHHAHSTTTLDRLQYYSCFVSDLAPAATKHQSVIAPTTMSDELYDGFSARQLFRDEESHGLTFDDIIALVRCTLLDGLDCHEDSAL